MSIAVPLEALPSVEVVAKMIDHSLLRPELTDDEVADGCELAHRYNVASVCVKPADVPRVVRLLEGSAVLVGSVVGFPHGSSSTAIKVAETQEIVAAGASEIDMVINIGKLRSGDLDYVVDDIVAVVAAADGRVVKVILENAYLSDQEKVDAFRLVEKAGAAFVKTSTGFAPGGATKEDIALMRRTVSPRVAVKAAGGVRSLDTLLELHRLGATRFGATVTAEILDDLKYRLEHDGEPRHSVTVSAGGY